MKALARITLILLLYAGLVSCQAHMPIATSTNAPTKAVEAPIVPSATQTDSAAPTSMSVPSATPTDSPTVTAVPPTVTPIPVQLPLRTFEQRCVTLQETRSPDLLTQGSILLSRYDLADKRHKELLLLGAQDQQPHPLPDLPQGGKCRIISPDGNWLVCLDAEKMLLYSSDLDLQASYPSNDQWGSLQSWFDNERLVFVNSPQIYILNPLTGQRQTITPKLDNHLEFSLGDTWELVLDPFLTRIVYERNHGGTEIPGIVLVDMETNETLWELRRLSPGVEYMPVWSPDGSQMAVIADDNFGAVDHFEIYTVRRDGQATQWIDWTVAADTWFGDKFKWSPDGRYLAFYEKSLYVLDTSTRQALDLCIPYMMQDPVVLPITFLQWSPDSKQIIFQRGDAPAVIVDLERNTAAPLVDDVQLLLVGWLRAEP